MRRWGAELEGVELGNAWTLRSPETPHTNWVVGDHGGIAIESLRFLRHGSHPEGPQPVEDVALKWFAHHPDDPPEWGETKPLSTGCTLTRLAGEGAFELCLSRGGEALRVLLEEPGDFVIWGPGLSHSWQVRRPSLMVTLRWRTR
jgi:hypothetical protein